MKERILGGLLGLFLGGQMGGVFRQRLAGFYESFFAVLGSFPPERAHKC